MVETFDMLAREIAEQRLRARRAERRLHDVDRMLETLGVAMWETDPGLRLVGSVGLAIADGYLDGPIGEFYRAVYGIEDRPGGPIDAHREACEGRRVALGVRHADRQFAVLVEPKKDGNGSVVGTVGLSLELGR